MTSMYENATPRPWRARIWRASGRADTVCIYARGDDEIIGWNGFDGAPCTKAEIRANAKLIAHAVNSIERLEAINAELLEALNNLLPGKMCGESWDLPDSETFAVNVTFGALKAARATIAKATKP